MGTPTRRNRNELRIRPPAKAGGLLRYFLYEEKCAQWKKAVEEVARYSIRYVQEVEDMQE